jgi:pyridoxal phosphate enzyme (YggS family)
MSIALNIEAIRARIAAAAESCGRDPKEIILVGASKMNDAAACREAIAAGIDVLGENRVQEMTSKLAENAYDGAPLHFIGHLQKNKVRQVVGLATLIHSVDSVELLGTIDRCAAARGLVQDVLLEINIGGEESKTGFTVAEVYEILPKMPEFPNVRVQGFMAIPPICQNPGENDKFFQEMYNLSVDITAKKYDNVWVRFLSMGMSDDFRDAIACGSTMIRVGTAIFGARDYSNTQIN